MTGYDLTLFKKYVRHIGTIASIPLQRNLKTYTAMTISFAPRTVRALRSLPRKDRRTMAWALSGNIDERHLSPVQLMVLGVLRFYQQQAAC